MPCPMLPIKGAVTGLVVRRLEGKEHHAAMVALYFVHYNFGRVQRTTRVTPAMEAGRANHVWSIEETVCLLG